MTQRHALVTGAAHGIGRAIAKRLHDDGYGLYLLDHDEAGINSLRAELAGAQALIVDAADAAALGNAAAAITRLDALVNNAGVMRRVAPEQLDLADWRRVLDTNLTAAFVLSKQLAPALRGQNGAIVNIASTRAGMSEPHTEAYAASKGGLVALSHALAISLGPDIRVNAISPGWIDVAGETLRAIDHEQHPVGRVGRPEDVAELTAYLLDNARAGFITGQDFTIDGGMTKKMIYAH